MTLCRSGGCHENGRHEAPSDSIMESIMESLANCVAKMLLGEHILQQPCFPDAILFGIVGLLSWCRTVTVFSPWCPW